MSSKTMKKLAPTTRSAVLGVRARAAARPQTRAEPRSDAGSVSGTKSRRAKLRTPAATRTRPLKPVPVDEEVVETLAFAGEGALKSVGAAEAVLEEEAAAPEAAEPSDEINESVAELEAVAEEEEEPAETTSRDSDEPSNFLGLYFKDMARLAVLRPEEEFESARKIEQLEILLWTNLLGHAPLTDHMLKVVERTLENSLPEFRQLHRLALDALRPSAPKSAQEKLTQLARRTAERLRAIDIDKNNLEMVAQELRKIARNSESVVGPRARLVSQWDFWVNESAALSRSRG